MFLSQSIIIAFANGSATTLRDEIDTHNTSPPLTGQEPAFSAAPVRGGRGRGRVPSWASWTGRWRSSRVRPEVSDGLIRSGSPGWVQSRGSRPQPALV